MRAATRAILANGLVDWETAGELFDIFFKYVSVSTLRIPLRPRSPHVQNVYERDPFLFTVVLTISSRYLPSRPGLHITAMYFAKHAAAIAFIDGVKSVEMAQAYLLMSVYGLPARRWEEDRSWFPSTAPLSERHERERLNCARTWLNCFDVDRSSSTQWGPTGIQEDEAIRGAKAWHRGSKYNHPYDAHLVAYMELLKIVSRFHESIHTPSGTSPDFRAITETTEAEIRGWHDSVKWSYENESDRNDPANFVRLEGVPVFENYMRLVMYSFGFEDAWKRHGLEPGDMFFAKCLQSAMAVVRHLSEIYAPSGFLKYAPDCFFVMGGFCSAFLLKMLRPEFATLLDKESRKRIVALVTGFVDVLASSKAFIDERHTPKLYAKFLNGQLRFVTVKVPPVPVQKQKQPHQYAVASHDTDTASQDRVFPSTSGHTSPVSDLVQPPHTPAHSFSSRQPSVPTPDVEQYGTSHGWDFWTETGSTTGSGSVTAAAAGGVVDYDPMEPMPRSIHGTAGSESDAAFYSCKPILNFSNTKHTLVFTHPLIPDDDEDRLSCSKYILSSQAQKQLQTSSPNHAPAAIPRLDTSSGIDMNISIAFNASNNMPFNTLSHRLLTHCPLLDPRDYALTTSASVSVNPPEIVRGFMFGSKG
ncbi:hypothetical protein BU17DRAFT_93862 [Hysterangium stoloniferum]|nr:hypothetical protein BU17DRAFT_93862 [Hysterangium stoloniferum]